MSETTIYSATIAITDIDFKAMSGTVGSTPCTEATLTLMPQPSGQPEGIFTGNGDNIVVTVPEINPGTVVLNFTLDVPQYTLLGLAFVPSSDDGVGINEFPSISLSRSEGTSLLAVTDDYLKSDDDITFDYLILIQDTTTGNIGAIDPKIRSGIN
ncbi:MAG: hypothetical protein ACOYLU_08245 [Limisphaerales bacterium]